MNWTENKARKKIEKETKLRQVHGDADVDVDGSCQLAIESRAWGLRLLVFWPVGLGLESESESEAALVRLFNPSKEIIFIN